jgi:ABC-type multidrug transport system permease subunit
MRILDLTLKDLVQIFRDRKILLFLVAMPVAFTIFMGYMYRSPAQASDPRLALGWVDGDPQGALSQALRTMFENSGAFKIVDIQQSQASEMVGSGKLAAALIIPKDFSQNTLTGMSTPITLLGDESSNTGQQVLQLARPLILRLNSAVEIARISNEAGSASPAIDGGGLAKTNAGQAALLASFNQAVQAWSQLDAGEPVVASEMAFGKSGSGDETAENPYNQTSPGILVMFSIFSLVTSASLLVAERKTRTLQRLMTTSMKPWQIIAGHLLAMFSLVFLQSLMLVVFGQLVLKVDYLRQPFGIFLVVLSLGLWVASMGLLIGVIARGDEQVVLYSMVAMFVFAALGGAWFPLEGAGRAFATIGHLTPAAWAMDGFQNILVRGLSLGSVLLPAGILLAYALGFFGLATWRFRQGQLD